jgi:hypothetical protein
MAAKVQPQTTVSYSPRFLRDDVPARHVAHDLEFSTIVQPFIMIRAGYRFLDVEQDTTQGLQRIRRTLHTLQAGMIAGLFNNRLELTVGSRAHFSPDQSSAFDYQSGLRYRHSVADPFGTPMLQFSLAVEAASRPELSVATAIAEGIRFDELAVEAGGEYSNVLSLAGRFARQQYSDGNTKTIAFAYGLIHPFVDPWFAVGYAYVYSTSAFDNWKLTDTRRTSFNPMTREATYEYSYFYYPYFTPMEERGHLLIGVVRWSPVSQLYLYGKASVPVSSTGQQKYFPSSGNTPAPPDYNAYYEAAGIVPSQYEATVATDILGPVIFQVGAEYFTKPYYTYSAVWIRLTTHIN